MVWLRRLTLCWHRLQRISVFRHLYTSDEWHEVELSTCKYAQMLLYSFCRDFVVISNSGRYESLFESVFVISAKPNYDERFCNRSTVPG